ncbi:MAG TPA: twin-arginine translocation pathway signal protein, partial [Phycisphaerales bacterium]|nr:twin-arginine translocation pathway signal protein [Phycisphaerales bacterium]
MNRRAFIKTAGWAVASTVLTGCRPASISSMQPKTERPLNVLLIMIDDLGWTDLHCQGNNRLET